jgi:RNA polymerase sigma-70 factor (ECF subfamily)
MLAETSTHISLLERVAKPADAGAWRDFCDRYGDLIRGFAARRGLQTADRDDILQDVLISLRQALPGFTYDPAKGKFRSYLKTVVLRAVFKRSCQSHAAIALERVEDLTRAAARDTDVDDEWETEWRQYHLRRAMQTLHAEFNSADRTAFQEYAVDGQDAETVAKRLGISVESVYQAKSRILKRLSALIDDQVREEG